MYHVRREDVDSVIDYLNVFTTLVSLLISVDINMEEEDKCITFLCSLPYLWGNLFVAIGSRTKSTLKFEDVVSSFLLEETRIKSMENHSTNALSVRPGHTKETRKSAGGRSKYRGIYKSIGDPLKKLC